MFQGRKCIKCCKMPFQLITIKMISRELMEHISHLRTTDHQFTKSINTLFDISSTQYYQQLQLLLQQSEKMGFGSTTKYLAKKYYDVFFAKYSHFTDENALLVIFTCLRTAAKFNESLPVSDSYNFGYCITLCGGLYNKQDFILCQLRLVQALDFDFRLASPYEFTTVKALLPRLRQLINILNSIIDFTLCFPQLRAASAEALFFGSLLYVCKSKNESDIGYKIIEALTLKWDESKQVYNVIQQNMNRLLQQ